MILVKRTKWYTNNRGLFAPLQRMNLQNPRSHTFNPNKGRTPGLCTCSLFLCPWPCYVTPGVPCTLKDLWVINPVLINWLVGAEVCLTIVTRTTAAGPATWLLKLKGLWRLAPVQAQMSTPGMYNWLLVAETDPKQQLKQVWNYLSSIYLSTYLSFLLSFYLHIRVINRLKTTK